MDVSFTAMMVQSIASLALVLAIFAGVIWGLKRLQQWQTSPVNRQGSMRVEQRLALDSHHSIVEVSREGKRYILSLSSGHVQLLDTLQTLDADAKKDVHD